MQIQQLMTCALATCRPDDRLDHAVKLMWERDIGCVVVTDRENRLVGIVTDRDACMAAFTQDRPLGQIPVATAMAHQPWTCGPTAAPRDVERIMSTHQVRRIPVVDARGCAIGIVTLNDLARAARASADAPINQREVETTLAAISMPRHIA